MNTETPRGNMHTYARALWGVTQPLPHSYVHQVQDFTDYQRAGMPIEQLRALLLKEDVYAGAVGVIDTSVTRMYEQRDKRPPFGFTLPMDHQISEEDEVVITQAKYSPHQLRFFKAGTALGNTVEIGIDLTLQEMMNNVANNPGDPANERFLRFSEMARTYAHDFLQADISVERFLKRGATTAARAIMGLYAVTPLVYRQTFPDKPMDPEEIVQIAQASFPLILEIARINIHEVHRNTLARVIGRMIASGLTIKENRRGKLQLVQNHEFTLQPTARMPVPPIKSITYGCPGMVHLLGKSAIEKIMDWGAEVAVKLYKETFARELS